MNIPYTNIVDVLVRDRLYKMNEHLIAMLLVLMDVDEVRFELVHHDYCLRRNNARIHCNGNADTSECLENAYDIDYTFDQILLQCDEGDDYGRTKTFEETT